MSDCCQCCCIEIKPPPVIVDTACIDSQTGAVRWVHGRNFQTTAIAFPVGNQACNWAWSESRTSGTPNQMDVQMISSSGFLVGYEKKAFSSLSPIMQSLDGGRVYVLPSAVTGSNSRTVSAIAYDSGGVVSEEIALLGDASATVNGQIVGLNGDLFTLEPASVRRFPGGALVAGTRVYYGTHMGVGQPSPGALWRTYDLDGQPYGDPIPSITHSPNRIIPIGTEGFVHWDNNNSNPVLRRIDGTVVTSWGGNVNWTMKPAMSDGTVFLNGQFINQSRLIAPDLSTVATRAVVFSLASYRVVPDGIVGRMGSRLRKLDLNLNDVWDIAIPDDSWDYLTYWPSQDAILISGTGEDYNFLPSNFKVY